MKTLAIFSDAHTNSSVGLCKPSVDVQDGDKVASGEVRRWIFNSFENILEEIDKKARGELHGVLNGDMVEVDDKDRSIQVISQNIAEVVQMATDLWSPFFQSAKSAWVIRGTEAHVGKNAQVEELFAMSFDNTVKNEDTGKRTWVHLPLELDGVRMDIMHHPKGGQGRSMNYNGVADRLAVDTLFDYANNGETPPHLAIRSHLHRYIDSKDAFRVRGIITPGLTFNSSYISRIGVSRQNDIGAILVYCNNGEYHVEPVLHKPRRPQWIVL